MTCDRWHMTCDTWQVTHDRWHVTHDTWCGVTILSKFQLSSSNGLGVMMCWRSGGKGSLTQLINHEAVCRAAPATLGLLNRYLQMAHKEKNVMLLWLLCRKNYFTFLKKFKHCNRTLVGITFWTKLTYNLCSGNLSNISTVGSTSCSTFLL